MVLDIAEAGEDENAIIAGIYTNIPEAETRLSERAVTFLASMLVSIKELYNLNPENSQPISQEKIDATNVELK